MHRAVSAFHFLLLWDFPTGDKSNSANTACPHLPSFAAMPSTVHSSAQDWCCCCSTSALFPLWGLTAGSCSAFPSWVDCGLPGVGSEGSHAGQSEALELSTLFCCFSVTGAGRPDEKWFQCGLCHGAGPAAAAAQRMPAFLPWSPLQFVVVGCHEHS